MLKRIVGRFSLVGEIFAYLWREQRFSLIVVMIFLIVLSLLVVAADSGSVAPFIYTLF